MLHYVATPYSKYPEGIETAFIEAAKATATLLKSGIAVYSPIAHTHPIAMHGQMDAYDHDIWMPLDAHMMDAAGAMIVVMMPGWRESKGIGIEIDTFKKAGKPIRFFQWPEMKEVDHVA